MSIEEDIERLNKLVTTKFNNDYSIDNIDKEAIEHLLSDYTRQKQINEEHQKTNGELREKVKELEEQVKYDKTHIYTPLTIQLNFIPKQKIEDKKEEFSDKAKRIAGTYQYADSEDDLIEKKNKVIKLRTKAEAFEELLQESEDK